MSMFTENTFHVILHINLENKNPVGSKKKPILTTKKLFNYKHKQ